MNARRRRVLRLGGGVLGVLTFAVASIYLWYLSGGPEATLRVLDGPIYGVAFSPDGKTLASNGFHRVVLWDLATLRERASMTDQSRMVFSPDGKLLATVASDGGADGDVSLWDVATGRLTAIVPKSESPAWVARSAPVSPDGRIRVETDHPYYAKTLSLCDAATDRKLIELEGHPDQLNAWDFAPGGRLLATGGGYTSHPWPVNRAGDARIWDVSSGRLLAKLSRQWGAVSDVAFSPDGKMLASASYDGTIMLWNVARIVGL